MVPRPFFSGKVGEKGKERGGQQCLGEGCREESPVVGRREECIERED